jgi:hypothetical protein
MLFENSQLGRGCHFFTFSLFEHHWMPITRTSKSWTWSFKFHLMFKF